MTSQKSASSDIYNLRWNSYSSTLINLFSDLQSQEFLVDVTLSCEGHFIKAHRLILSACSVYFQKIFEINTAQHIVIVLNDIKLKYLQLLIQFMYKGEVKVVDSELQNFLHIGRLLQVRGLCAVEFQDKPPILKTNNNNLNNKISEVKQNTMLPQNDDSLIEKTEATTSGDTNEKIAAKKRKLSLPKKVLTEVETSQKSKKLPPQSSQPPDLSRVRRPPNAFMLFANQWRSKLAVEYPNESNKEISVRLSSMWKSLSQETKDQFYDDARRIDEDHQTKYPRYHYNQDEGKSEKTAENLSKEAQTNSFVYVDVRGLDNDEDDVIEVRCEQNGSSN